jgi:hypothetical protein
MRTRSAQKPAIRVTPIAHAPSDGPRAYPILEVFARLGVATTRGYGFVASGELETYLVGRNRYATEDAIRRLIQRYVEASAGETAAQRAKRVSAAVSARQRGRAVLLAPSEPRRRASRLPHPRQRRAA